MDATSSTLVQEFLKVKGDVSSRESTLVAVCRRTFTSRTLIFVRSKASAHRLTVLFGLLGMKADELHGNLSQEQRMTALTRFKEEQVEYLIATDLASRGLDIRGIESVINFEMPKSLDIYLYVSLQFCPWALVNKNVQTSSWPDCSSWQSWSVIDASRREGPPYRQASH
jgi:ATP-dependent RNA helicase DDX27